MWILFDLEYSIAKNFSHHGWFKEFYRYITFLKAQARLTRTGTLQQWDEWLEHKHMSTTALYCYFIIDNIACC